MDDSTLIDKIKKPKSARSSPLLTLTSWILIIRGWQPDVTSLTTYSNKRTGLLNQHQVGDILPFKMSHTNLFLNFIYIKRDPQHKYICFFKNSRLLFEVQDYYGQTKVGFEISNVCPSNANFGWKKLLRSQSSQKILRRSNGDGCSARCHTSGIELKRTRLHYL